MADNNSNLRGLILPGLLTIFGTILGGLVTGYLNVKLAEEKYQSDLILKALESGSPDERLQTLKMMVHTNLIKESSIRDSVDRYILENQDNPSRIPQVRAANAIVPEAPVIDNARIWLLSGKGRNNLLINVDSLNLTLTGAGFKVGGTKLQMVDAGRPIAPEIRYFNVADQLQAEKLGDFMKGRYGEAYPVKAYIDPKAGPGYIEIWMGK